jgi:hypothetical protein
MRHELEYLLRFWFWSILLPLPFLLFYHSPEGRSLALNGFFLGCLILVAYSFRRDVAGPDGMRVTPRFWRQRLLPLSVALFVAFLVFSLVCTLVNNPHDFGTPRAKTDQGIWLRAFVFKTPRDFVAPMLALMALIPSLCVVPYFVLITRKPPAAIVFAAWLVGCMKLLGATVVVIVYGWDADVQGRTKMPWNHPDLLVWLFWSLTGFFSLMFCALGVRKFHLRYRSQPPAALEPTPTSL